MMTTHLLRRFEDSVEFHADSDSSPDPIASCSVLLIVVVG